MKCHTTSSTLTITASAVMCSSQNFTSTASWSLVMNLNQPIGMSKQQKLFLAIAFFVGAIIIGGTLISYAFGGLITFFSFVLMLNNVPFLRYIVYKLNWMFEIIIFVFGIYAKLHFGVTIAMSLMIAGILYGLLYHDYLQDTYNLKNDK